MALSPLIYLSTCRTMNQLEIPMTTNTDRRQLLLWEAMWGLTELLGVGICLFVGLVLANWPIAGLMLYAVLCLSFVVRITHYSKALAKD